MKTRKYMTPLLSALAASMLCANLAAVVSAHGIYQKFDTDGWGQPIISVLMQGLSHGGSVGAPADKSTKDNASSQLTSSQSSTGEIPDVLAGQPEAAVSVSVSGSSTDSDFGGQQSAGTTGSGNHVGSNANDGSNNHSGSNVNDSSSTASSYGSTEQQTGETTVPDRALGSNADSRQDTCADSSDTAISGADGGSAGSSGNTQNTTPTPDGTQTNSDSTSQAEPGQYAFTEVTQDYFDDALFIGDSRVTGVELYSGWDNLTYYAEGGMTIYSMLQSKTAQMDGQTLSIEEALQKRSFGKIYLEIGINEMGTGTADSFMEAYEANLARLQELQPDAIIYVCGIMYVKQSRSESDPIFNNPAIQERNDRIAQLADGKQIFYLDINEVVTDETGNLNPDYTWDEVHLLGKYDIIWLEYFSSHGIVK